jgi:hypothetical protein
LPISSIGVHLEKEYKGKKMLKKSVVTLFVSALLASTGISTLAHAATISNGSACAKPGASTTVKVKGLGKTYICTINPAAAGNPNIAKKGKTWTLKTCLTYYAQYKTYQKNLSDQKDLINLLTEPDKSAAMKGYNDGVVSLDHTLAAIENNYCKTGL